MTLTSSLPTILRYETNLKRDYYRALNALLELQRQRKEDEKNQIRLVETFLRNKATKSH